MVLLGDIGGLSEALSFMGYLLVGFFSNRMMNASIIKKIYHVKK
jgi:hypothetical protein